MHNSALKASVHVFYHHPHLRVQAAKVETGANQATAKFLYGLLSPRKIEAFRKTVTPKALKYSAVRSAKAGSPLKQSKRIREVAVHKINNDLAKWIEKGKFDSKTLNSAAKTPLKTASTRGEAY